VAVPAGKYWLAVDLSRIHVGFVQLGAEPWDRSLSSVNKYNPHRRERRVAGLDRLAQRWGRVRIRIRRHARRAVAGRAALCLLPGGQRRRLAGAWRASCASSGQCWRLIGYYLIGMYYQPALAGRSSAAT